MRRGLPALLLAAGLAHGHEVRLESARQEAVVVSLAYAGGQPFAFEAYELYLPGKETPEQVGRTDAAGRVVFLPGEHPAWRIKAYSADGHGVDQALRVAPATVGSAPAVTGEPSRALSVAVGMGVLFGLFGLLQLFVRRKRS